MEVGICVAGGVEELEQVDLAMLREIGLNSIYLGCYENEMRWNAEEYSAFVRAASTAGFEVCAVPWGYGKVVDPDPAIDSLYVDTHREQLQVDSRGRRAYKACPNNPKFLEWFASEMRTMAWMLEAHGFLWDEPSFYFSRGTWACRCEYCQRLFSAAENYAMPRELNEPVRAFRRFSVKVFVLAAAAAVQAVDGRLYSLVMPSPALDTTQDNTGTDDWGDLLDSSAVDGISLYVPWQEHQVDPSHAIQELHTLAIARQQSTLKPCHLWLAASPRPQDRTTENILSASQAGCPRVVLTDYTTVFRAQGSSRFVPRLREVVSQVRS
jgi:hypothetical protein